MRNRLREGSSCERGGWRDVQCIVPEVWNGAGAGTWMWEEGRERAKERKTDRIATGCRTGTSRPGRNCPLSVIAWLRHPAMTNRPASSVVLLFSSISDLELDWAGLGSE